MNASYFEGTLGSNPVGHQVEEPPAMENTGTGSLDEILTRIERREILAALERAQGQRTKAARMLGISRSRLYRRMEALGIDPKDSDGNTAE
ncbi:MAG: hypothetical protein J5J06_00720 [Phycisphaerae bacterium]|nr:hypothetical protein [Phycisphaerae bacterium]